MLKRPMPPTIGGPVDDLSVADRPTRGRADKFNVIPNIDLIYLIGGPGRSSIGGLINDLFIIIV